jgi:hypothetical protein
MWEVITIILVCLLIVLTAALPLTAVILVRRTRVLRAEAYHSWEVAQDFCQLTGDCARLLDRLRYLYRCDPFTLAQAISTLSEAEQAHVKPSTQIVAVDHYLVKIETTMSKHSGFIGQSREYANKPKPGEAGIGTFR